MAREWWSDHRDEALRGMAKAIVAALREGNRAYLRAMSKEETDSRPLLEYLEQRCLAPDLEQRLVALMHAAVHPEEIPESLYPFFEDLVSQAPVRIWKRIVKDASCDVTKAWLCERASYEFELDDDPVEFAKNQLPQSGLCTVFRGYLSEQEWLGEILAQLRSAGFQGLLKHSVKKARGRDKESSIVHLFAAKFGADGAVLKRAAYLEALRHALAQRMATGDHPDVWFTAILLEVGPEWLTEECKDMLCASKHVLEELSWLPGDPEAQAREYTHRLPKAMRAKMALALLRDQMPLPSPIRIRTGYYKKYRREVARAKDIAIKICRKPIRGVGIEQRSRSSPG